MSKNILLAITITLSLYACTKEKGVPEPTTVVCTDTISYSTDIAPIMNANCTSGGCHDSGSGNGDYTGYAGLKIDADNSKLINRVVVLKNMPPGGALPDSLIAKINCWVEQGALNN
jgi:hypothetical protein